MKIAIVSNLSLHVNTIIKDQIVDSVSIIIDNCMIESQCVMMVLSMIRLHSLAVDDF